MQQQFVSVPSPVESLISGSTGVWSGLENGSPDQFTKRRELYERLEAAFRFIGPNEIDWDCSESSRLVTDLYASLNQLLKAGNDRFILYCPLNILPEASWFRNHGNVVDEFAELYLSAWHRMLEVEDIEANFLDGDVPDIELKDRPMRRVIKAAQLGPHLVYKGLISNQFMEQLSENEKYEHLPHRTRPRAAIIPEGEFTEYLALHLNSFPYVAGSKKRQDWLLWEHRRRTIQKIGRSLGHFFSSGIYSIESVGPLNQDSREALLVGIGSAIEAVPRLYGQFEYDLLTLCNDQTLRNTAAMVASRLFSCGAMPKTSFEALGFFFPHLDGPWSLNLAAAKEGREKARKALEEDAELCSVIFPVTIAFGSKLKGYGGPDSDLDLAVLVRPGVTDRDAVTRLVRNRLGDDVVQFWLEDFQGYLRVHDFEQYEAKIGDSTNTHVLFGGAWEGDRETIEMLGRQLLKPYCYNHGPNRALWLEEMERDALQYRLLHRGFERFFVTEEEDTFWDHGYRVAASRLYASQVFIPTYL